MGKKKAVAAEAVMTTEGLTPAQQQMVDDGLPKECLIDQKEREEAWKETPPKPTAPLMEGPPIKEVPADVQAFAEEEEGRKKVKTKNRIAKMVDKSKAPDPKTHRWNSVRNRWEPLDKDTASKKSETVVKKNTKKAVDANPTNAVLIALLQRKNGANVKDFQEAGYVRSAKGLIKMAEKLGYKTSSKKEPGELTRYFASKGE